MILGEYLVKHAYIGLLAVLAVALAPALQARSLRADIQCPFGNGGIAWTPSAGNPMSVNTGVSGAFSSLFTAPAGQVGSDDVGLSVTAATQYNTYQNTPPAASSCSGGDTDNITGPLAPLAQVLTYQLAAGGFASAGDVEVEFNYQAGVTSGPASFTLAGMTFSARGLSAASESDFLFNSAGSFLGAITGDFGDATLVKNVLPTGWSSAGGGAVNAPEIDAGGAAGALGLLCAGLAVVRARRRI